MIFLYQNAAVSCLLPFQLPSEGSCKDRCELLGFQLVFISTKVLRELGAFKNVLVVCQHKEMIMDADLPSLNSVLNSWQSAASLGHCQSEARVSTYSPWTKGLYSA